MRVVDDEALTYVKASFCHSLKSSAIASPWLGANVGGSMTPSCSTLHFSGSLTDRELFKSKGRSRTPFACSPKPVNAQLRALLVRQWEYVSVWLLPGQFAASRSSIGH